jgi:hypothetical protein
MLLLGRYTTTAIRLVRTNVCLRDRIEPSSIMVGPGHSVLELPPRE